MAMQTETTKATQAEISNTRETPGCISFELLGIRCEINLPRYVELLAAGVSKDQRLQESFSVNLPNPK